jgi:putative endonuclease
MSNSRQSLGQWGESKAAEYLQTKGYQVLACNVVTPYGEIDLLATHLEELVFVEVKTRRSRAYGNPETSITPKKMQHMIDSALAYLQEHPEYTGDWRIDVIAIQKLPNDQVEITHFENVSL